MERNCTWLEKGLSGLIRVYRYCLSPYLGSACRFYPSCSLYAEECLKEWGFFSAVVLSARRLLKCHPWHPGGVDFVPTRSGNKADSKRKCKE